LSAWAADELAPLTARLAPYARASFDQAAALAARLHAEEISPEHWLAALLADEGCAATRAVLHAFADPETLGIEVLALCAGIMVVGSERTLPFSVRGVEVLHAARARADARRAPAVEPADLFASALAFLAGEAGTRLAGVAGAALAPWTSAGAAAAPAFRAGPLLGGFSAQSLRALGASARSAASFAREAIGPAHVLLGVLEVDEGLRSELGLATGRTRMALAGVDADSTPLPPRRIAAEPRLQALLASLPAEAETLDVLAEMLARASEELKALLLRQKVTGALIERCRGTFRDPAL
jgi:hypothetical protein